MTKDERNVYDQPLLSEIVQISRRKTKTLSLIFSCHLYGDTTNIVNFSIIKSDFQCIIAISESTITLSNHLSPPHTLKPVQDFRRTSRQKTCPYGHKESDCCHYTSASSSIMSAILQTKISLPSARIYTSSHITAGWCKILALDARFPILNYVTQM